MFSNCLNKDDNNWEGSMDIDWKEQQSDETEEDICENDYGPNDTANNVWNYDNKDGGEADSVVITIESDSDDADIITIEDDSSVSSTAGSVTNTNSSHSNRSNCASPNCYNSMKSVFSKYNIISMQEQLKVEENAIRLFETTRSEEDRNIDWCDLNLQQKIPFLWATLCGENLSDDPIDNFKQFYVMNAPRSTNTTMRELKRDSLIVWEAMNTKQRLPFKVQAFISKVADGEANVEDADDLQRFLEIIQ